MRERNQLLRQARLERCWTQEELADQIGVSKETISRWETGVNKPQPFPLRKLCEVFEKSQEALGYPLEDMAVREEIASPLLLESASLQRETVPPLPLKLVFLQEKMASLPPLRSRESSMVIKSLSGRIVALLILSIIGGFVFSGSASALLTQALSSNCGGAFFDESHGKLASEWDPVNFGGSTTYNLTMTHLSLSASAHSDLNPQYNFNAPRLLQPIAGDFTIQTHLEFCPNANFQSAGLLLWQDPTTFMRFERGFGKKTSGILLQKWDHGRFTNVSGKFWPSLTGAGSVELRIQRQGDHFTAWWREYGQQKWQKIGDTDIHFTSLKIGVDLIADFNAPQITAFYDYLSISHPN